MKKLKSILSIILSLTILSGVFFSFGQDNIQKDIPTVDPGISFGDCYNQHINNVFTIRCIIKNKDKAQKNIQFYVNLKNKDNTYTSTLGEPFSLNKKETKELNYNIDTTKYTEGVYTIYPAIKIDDSFVLYNTATGEAGDVSITHKKAEEIVNNNIINDNINNNYYYITGVILIILLIIILIIMRKNNTNIISNNKN